MGVSQGPTRAMLTPCNQSFIDGLTAKLPSLAIKTAEPRYLEEPRNKYFGQATFVALPTLTEEVSDVVSFANQARVGVQPYGGGTGLVGGQLSDEGPPCLILSLENMARIRAVHRNESTLVAEAGATVESIHHAAEEAGLLFPLSYASQGTAQIGAGLAVNSGGLNVLRYGMARDLCLGIEAVLADGSIFHGLKRLRKDNTGYDLRNLLIGAEGTLGIITAASLKLFPAPTRTGTAFLDVAGPGAALELLARLKDAAGDTVSAFEIMAGTGMEFLAETHPDTRQPFATPPEWSVLVELATPDNLDPQSILESCFADALEDELVTDGLIATSGTQRAEFWNVREMIPVANRTIGAIASHDISLPLSELADFVDKTGRALEAFGPLRVNAFGHLGDGNLHYNIFPPTGRSSSDFQNVAPEITRMIHDEVAAREGSFSAEHGIGRLKTKELERYADPAKLAAMRAIKTALDPNGILNPGAVLS